MSGTTIGIIGGSGLYDIQGLEDVRECLDGMWPAALARLGVAAEREHASGRADAGRN